MRRICSGAASLLIFAIASCGSDVTAPKVQVPTALLVVAGDAQTVVVGSAVTTAPTVRLVDADGVAIAGATVTFSVGSGGGGVTGATATTDATGVAKVGGWTLGTTAGANTLVATSGSLTATFNASGTASRAFSITPVAGKDQNAAVGSNVAIAPSVAVRDTFANPVAGAVVTFAVATGGGSVTGGTATSDANGIATLGGWKLGTTLGANSLTASSGALTTTIGATAIAGPPASIVVVAGKDQVATAGTKVPTPPSVVIRDAFANPIANAPVTFSPGSAGGTVTGGSVATDAQGVAAVGSWTLGGQSGPYSLTASSGSANTTISATAISPAFDGSLRFTALSSGLASVSGSALHACALDVNGRAYCWGSNSSGELGDASTISRTSPVAVFGSQTFVSLAGGSTHTCALTAAGAAYCWGSNASGELGDGSRSSRLFPAPVAGGITFKSIGAGYGFTCALATDGKAYCWGQGFLGRPGDGTQNDHTSPNPVSGGLTFASIAVGFGHACGLTSDGKAYCWGGGSPYHGQIGDGTAPIPSPPPADDPLYVKTRLTPTAVAGGMTFSQLTAGNAVTCGLEVSGKPYCWGLNNFGQIGDATTIDKGVPTLVSGSPAYVAITAGGSHICGRLQTGAVKCAGGNFDGQFGNGALTASAIPLDAGNGMTFVSIAAGEKSSCGIDASGKIYCWGNNDYGQLGDGTTTRRTTPVAVIFP